MAIRQCIAARQGIAQGMPRPSAMQVTGQGKAMHCSRQRPRHDSRHDKTRGGQRHGPT
ncbi:hypothetical protein RHMOL_RhmolUnG0007300 [Rhododendron molle]|nr:hypothetical protein RHMOL_RhmolUnG0007300 [Rhododendron molle]